MHPHSHWHVAQGSAQCLTLTNAKITERNVTKCYQHCVTLLPAGYKPFQGVSYEGIAAAVIQHAIADLPPHISPAFKAFIAAALTYDPQQRPSARQLLDHPWIQVGQKIFYSSR